MIKLKGAPFSIFILAMDQMTACNVKGITHTEKPTENYHQTLQFLSALQSVLASFSSLFWCYRPTAVFQQHRAAVYSEEAVVNPLRFACSAPNRQTYIVQVARNTIPDACLCCVCWMYIVHKRIHHSNFMQ